MARDGDEEMEFEGYAYGRAGAALVFQADEWDEKQFLPASRCRVEPMGDDNRAKAYIPLWLCRKNGWV